MKIDIDFKELSILLNSLSQIRDDYDVGSIKNMIGCEKSDFVILISKLSDIRDKGVL